MRRKSTTKGTGTRSFKAEATMIPVAVVRRSHFEGESWEVIVSPSLVLLAQGFESREAAEKWRDIYAKGLTP